MLRLLKKSFIILIYFVGVVLFVCSFFIAVVGFGFLLSFFFFFWQNFSDILKEDLIPGNISKWVKITVCNECKKGKNGFDFYCFGLDALCLLVNVLLTG